MEKFWKRVKNQIKAHKISQEKFCSYIGIPRSTLYRWIKNSISPDIATAYNIASALGVTLEYLIAGEDKNIEKIRMEQTQVRKTTEAEVKKLVEKLYQEVVKF